MKKQRILSALIVLAMLLCGAAAAETETLDVTTLYKTRDTDDNWSGIEVETIDLSAATDAEVVISAKGNYVLSGKYNGRVLIDAPEEDKVRLILNGVEIISPEGPAIYEKQADKLIITLAANTENTLTDGTPVTDDDDTIGAALYAEDDLSINGTGGLKINGTQKHGLQSKSDLIIANGNITVTAVKDGVRGRNSLLILDGKLDITAGGDGIVSTRKDKDGKGWMVLAGGQVTVKTGNGAAGASKVKSTSKKGIKATTDLSILGGDYILDCEDDGIKAANITIYGGSFDIRSGDDGMHADGHLTITGGNH